jgi:mono/diheme cytochrome c family protein
MMFPAHFWRNFAILWVAIVGLLGTAILLDNHQDIWTSATTPKSNISSSDLGEVALVAKGQELLILGNCIACHTDRGAAPGAGGRAFETPFGKVYSSNITADSQHGIGQWDTQDFWRALHHGKSKDGRLLTPVFPYQHTTLITREDSDALLAALKKLPAAANAKPIPKPSETLDWPYGTAVAIAVWRSLFFTPGTYVPESRQSAEWNRGAYIAQGLAHCAACHSERNSWGALSAVNDFSGGLLPVLNWYAPSLTSAKETGLASQSVADIALFLKAGQNDQAIASGPMAEVVQHSTQYWLDSDLNAVATYLKDMASKAPQIALKASSESMKKPSTSARVLSQGAKIYEQHCEQCHQAQGQGVPGAYPALANNRAILLNDPTNLVQSVLYGGYPAATQLNPRPYGMPPYILDLDDREIAAVLTHLRTQWGNQAAEVTPLQVNRIRALQGQ